MPFVKSKVTHFSEMNLNDEQFLKILKKMKYEYHPAGHKIFNFGEVGDKFYMIIEGGVQILIPQNFRKSTLETQKTMRNLQKPPNTMNHTRQRSL